MHGACASSRLPRQKNECNDVLSLWAMRSTILPDIACRTPLDSFRSPGKVDNNLSGNCLHSIVHHLLYRTKLCAEGSKLNISIVGRRADSPLLSAPLPTCLLVGRGRLQRSVVRGSSAVESTTRFEYRYVPLRSTAPLYHCVARFPIPCKSIKE